MRRFSALLLVTWLSLLIAEPAALHACAMHDGHGHAGIEQGQQPAAGAGVRSHGDHGEHADHVAPTAEPTDAPAELPDAEHCQCLGECCAAGVAALPLVELPASLETALPMLAVPASARGVAFRSPDLRLPPAHAPPAALTA